jgi:predicted nucleic acid-binding protein
LSILITRPFTPNAASFFDQIIDTDQLTVPEFCLLECANVIWKQVRFQAMPRSDAVNLLRLLRAIKLRRAPMKQLLNRSLEIALDNNLAVYDSGYLALALYYGYPLVTLDQPQRRAATAEDALLHPIGNLK